MVRRDRSALVICVIAAMVCAGDRSGAQQSSAPFTCPEKEPGWERLALSGPAPRREVALAYDPSRRALVIYGGQNPGAEGQRLRDTWEWDGDAWITSIFIEPPATEQGYAMAYDGNVGQVLLFGGGVSHPGGVFEHTNTMWGWEPPKWSIVSTGGPEPRSGARMVFDDARAVLVLHGGWAGAGGSRRLFNDTWEFDGSQWSLVSQEGPPARLGAAMAYDAERGVCVLFGGQIDALAGGPAELNDAWEWDGKAWRESDASGRPSARYDHAMAFDPRAGALVVYGGRSAGGWLADTWEFDGKAWRPVADGGPLARSGHGMAYDELHGQMLCFGGHVVGPGLSFLTQGLWARLADAPLLVERTPLSRLVQPSQEATLFAWVTGSGPLSYQWRRNGVPMSDTGRVRGAHSPTLRIAGCVPTDRARYDVIVTNVCGRTIQTGSALLAIGSWCPADLTGDGATTDQDLASLLGAWGPCPGCPADLDGSGGVNATDLAMLLGEWGQCN